MTKPKTPITPPRNAYERAAALFAELQRAAAALNGGEALVKGLAELWLAFEACIPDADKPKAQ